MKDQQRKQLEEQLLQEHLQKQKDNATAKLEKAEQPKNESTEESEDTDENIDSEESDNEEMYKILVGKKVNKSGLAIDKKSGSVIGRLVEGKAKKLAGKKIRENGVITDEKGNTIGRVEPVDQDTSDDSESESGDEESSSGTGARESKETKSKGVDELGDGGRVIKQNKRDIEKPEDDNNSNQTEKDQEAKKSVDENKDTESSTKFSNPYPLVDEHSAEVKKSGKVVDKNDNIVGNVDGRIARKLAGMKVDNEGNIVNHKGHIVGKAEMIKQKTDKEHKKEAEEEEYKKLADNMSNAIEQSLDKIKPVLKMITETIEHEESKPEKERDEQKLVDNVRPLIEQASNILSEAHGAIKGLDPTGQIAKTAQAKTSQRKASPEEYHLAELLSQLTGEVTTTIDKAKKKIKNMPYAKKQLSPLWNILQSPLLQILSAVGLLLAGVLGLVGNILNGLGLGSIVNSILGGTGLNKILEGFGLGDALCLGSKK
ncbi:hypothetical protein BCV72DRAFT_235489 [Rhizopus microsporus var. microsporus]|uniref:DUF6987 domain-containing protein n=2 Tax=Rhizopus microsporus TaxID=58291 RepID=A0A2G4T4C4_RHIZD|nr:uncharacterized protein RHIMIDRAFT_264384 [Rhizopus microsporus ATCC 52813]ORE01950.1 hypothetical protein BCV72DRAFT_235489 [Rhizopus microsporus var. microsporus]PHZ15849.1 hypothetical protein RHIMIDRAFT_264384 [Rhizopus microsporus ATCC 52813]